MSIRQGSKIIAGMPDLSSKADKETTYTKEEVNSLIQNVEVDAYTKEEVNNLLENIDALPEQTDNSGKLLSTDGENALWIDAPSSLPTMDETTSGKFLTNNNGNAEWIENPDITTNGWNIFDHKFSDHLLNDPSWVRSDTYSWQDGGIYFTAYEELEKEINNVESKTWYKYVDSSGNDFYSPDKIPNENTIFGQSILDDGRVYPVYSSAFKFISYDESTKTVAYIEPMFWSEGDDYKYATYVEGSDYEETVSTDYYDNGVYIIYYKSANGLKICLPDQSDAIEQLYANTGVAWYYIIDTENKRFKLPRKVSETLDLNTVAVVGNGKTLGFTNGTDTFGINSYASGGLRAVTNAYGTDIGQSINATVIDKQNTVGLTTDPENSGIIADLSSIGYKEVTEQTYLYFFMGDTLRDARIIDVNVAIEKANIIEEKLDNTVNKSTFQVVSELPEDLVENTFYFIVE